MQYATHIYQFHRQNRSGWMAPVMSAFVMRSWEIWQWRHLIVSRITHVWCSMKALYFLVNLWWEMKIVHFSSSVNEIQHWYHQIGWPVKHLVSIHGSTRYRNQSKLLSFVKNNHKLILLTWVCFFYSDCNHRSIRNNRIQVYFWTVSNFVHLFKLTLWKFEELFSLLWSKFITQILAKNRIQLYCYQWYINSDLCNKNKQSSRLVHRQCNSYYAQKSIKLADSKRWLWHGWFPRLALSELQFILYKWRKN